MTQVMQLQDLTKIYPITDTKLSGFSHSDQISQLTSAGASFIQLRDKDLSSKDLFDEAMSAMQIAHAAGAKLIINDRVDIALLTDADGVHLGQNDLDPTNARDLLGINKIIGYSTHTIAQVKEALNKPIDYIAFGPIFHTSTKLDHDPVVGLEMIKHVRELIGSFPLVVIGGIKRDNISDVIAAGADSAAIISDLFATESSISANFRSLQASL